MYQFQIYYHNRCVVRALYNTLDEAKKQIKEWPWYYDIDDCSYSLWVEVPSTEWL